MATCIVEFCERPATEKQMCRSHRRRFVRHGSPTAGGTAMGAAYQFLCDAYTYEGDGCLTWPFANVKGYGQIRIKEKTYLVSRLVCEKEHGEAPSPEHHAAHSCGKGHLGCVSRHHLSWKTPVGNNADKQQHGTILRGSGHSISKITESDVVEIRSLAGRVPQSRIAKMFGLTQPNVSMIVGMKSWKHVPGAHKEPGEPTLQVRTK